MVDHSPHSVDLELRDAMGDKGSQSLPTDAKSLCSSLVASFLGCKQGLIRTCCAEQGLEEMMIFLAFERPTGIS